jgi:hypothetical protein
VGVRECIEGLDMVTCAHVLVCCELQIQIAKINTSRAPLPLFTCLVSRRKMHEVQLHVSSDQAQRVWLRESEPVSLQVRIAGFIYESEWCGEMGWKVGEQPQKARGGDEQPHERGSILETQVLVDRGTPTVVRDDRELVIL